MNAERVGSYRHIFLDQEHVERIYKYGEVWWKINKMESEETVNRLEQALGNSSYAEV